MPARFSRRSSASALTISMALAIAACASILGVEPLEYATSDAASFDASGETVAEATDDVASQSVLVGTMEPQPNEEYISSGLPLAFVYTARSSGVVTVLGVLLGPSSLATTVQIGLYADSNGAPSTLLTKGTLIAPQKGLFSSVVVPEASVVAGTPYWIALLTLRGMGRAAVYDRAGSADATASVQYDAAAAQSDGGAPVVDTLPVSWQLGKVTLDGPITAYASR